jgi:outer membrane protein assembly factor BamB
MQTHKRRLLVALILALALAATITATVSAVFFGNPFAGTRATTHRSSVTATPVAKKTVTTRKPPPDGQDWTQYRFDVNGAGLNPEGSISVKNVASLVQNWAVHPTRSGFGSTPAVVNGIVYQTNGNGLYAFDLDSGETLWHFDDIPQSRGLVTSSVAVDSSSHLAYYGTPDARVYAVNTLTGKAVWQVQIGSPNAGAYIWSSPLVVHGNVYIGLASQNDNPCVRGGVFALDGLTGKKVWTHYTTGAGKLGGGVWSSVIAVPGKHEIIATTGNPCPHRVSDDDEDSVEAIDWDSGTTLWKYRAVAYDDCDCDFGQGAVDFVYHGQEYVVAGSKNGVVYALTPLEGNRSVQLVWSLKISKPGYLQYGGIFQPPTYSNGLVFVAGGPTPDGACPGGKLFAFQVDTGTVQWSACTIGQVVSPTSTTGDVLFVKQHYLLIAYEAATGRQLWHAEQHGEFWGGVAISRGSVLVGSVDGVLYCYNFSPSAKHSNSYS